MDNFLDVIIVRKNKGIYSLLYLLASLFMIIFFLFAAINVFNVLTQDETGAMRFNLIATITFVISGGLAVLLYWSRAFIKIDYDISFTNGFVEIARVANNMRRKELCRFYMKEVEAGGYTSSPNYKRYETMKDVTKYKAVLNRDAEVFYLYAVAKEKKALITIEATSDELIKLFHQYSPRNVKLDK